MIKNMGKDDLQNRFKTFSLNVLRLIRKLPRNDSNIVYGKQIIRSSSSIGANYAESKFAHSKQDFLHCLNISRKEANETLYWLEMIYNTNDNFKDEIKILMDENDQILRILISSVKTLRKNIENEK